MNHKKSAKDIAFDKERTNYKKQIQELNAEFVATTAAQKTTITKQREQIATLETQLAEKDDWIRRLLEYCDLSESEMRKIIEHDKDMADALESITHATKTMGDLFKHFPY